jgi:DNA-binding winged helix-turn-helix (wHTH) protein
MKTQTAEEIFDKHNIMTMAFNKQKVLNAMHDHTTTQIEALRERLKQNVRSDYFETFGIDETINNFLKEINP